jgi:hypothetical protein
MEIRRTKYENKEAKIIEELKKLFGDLMGWDQDCWVSTSVSGGGGLRSSGG